MGPKEEKGMELYKIVMVTTDERGEAVKSPFPGFYEKKDGIELLESLISKGIPAFMRSACVVR